MLYTAFEFMFYAGLVMLLTGIVWLCWTLVRRQWSRLLIPGVVCIVGAALAASPAVYTKFILSVDLGPRDKMVEGERHVTLTGWDGDSYNILLGKTDTVELRMANSDVDDITLRYLTDLSNLRVLDLNDSQVTDQGLKILAGLPKLKTIRLRNTKITDMGFRDYLVPMPNLQQLDLRETNISVDLVEQWKSQGDGRRAFR